MSTTASNPAIPVSGQPALDPEMPAPLPPEPLSMGDVFKIDVMRRLWFAQTISVFGDFLALFAVISVFTFKLHATAQQVTGVQIYYLLPIAILGVLAGVFVDRWPTKATLVASDLIRAGLCLLLVFATSFWHFYAILAAISVVSSFFGPAQGVAIRSAVPMHGLRAANALMQQVLFGMRIIGPGVAAFVVAYFGARTCYIVDSISFAGSATLIASVAIAANASLQGVRGSEKSDLSPGSGPAANPPHPIAKVWLDMKQGFQFILGHRRLLFVILALAAGMFVIGCFGPLIAVYVRDNLHESTRTFGVASAFIGVGMLVGVNLLTKFGKKLAETTMVYMGLGGIAGGLCLLTLIPHVWSTCLGDLIIGMSVAGIVVPSQTLIQQETPQALMGRVGSTVMSLVFTAQILGLVLSGVLSQAIGVRQVFAVCAVLLLVLIALGRLWMRERRTAAA